MDPTLLFWKYHGESFLSRLQIWVSVLDPTHLLATDPEIEKTRTVFGSNNELHEKDAGSTNLLPLASIHYDTGAPLPFLFRPPAFLPTATPMIVASLLPHNSVKTALFWQFLLQSYNAGFSHTNRNASSEQGKKTSLQQLLLIGGTVSYTTCAGALPQVFINRLGVTSAPLQVFFRSILPIPLSALLAYLSVVTVRSEESENGIQVFDSDGNPVGLSKAAGEQAVRETALSRAVLFGTTAAIPNILFLLLRRRGLFQKNPLLLAPLRHISIAFVLGLMIPVSFSLYPQLGTIKKEDVEAELQASTDNKRLFYHRGL